jgi:hypothetical protein
MIENLHRGSVGFYAAAVFGLLTHAVVKLCTGGPSALFAPLLPREEGALAFFVLLPAAGGVACTAVALLATGFRNLDAAVWRALDGFVTRFLAPHIAGLVARVASLELRLGLLDLRGGVLCARGLILSDAAGIERLMLGVADDGSSAIVLSGGTGAASVVLSAFEQRATIDLLDAGERPRLRAGTNGKDVWIGLHDSQDKPRAGFLVQEERAWLLMRDGEEEREQEKAGVEREVAGYL